MVNNRNIIFYWIIILIPSLIIGWSAISLLSHEQERKNSESIKALEAQAESISQTIKLTIENIKDELTRSLVSLEDSRRNEILISWSEKNPLIRNVFIWDRIMRLQYPVDSRASTYEEKMFIKRYEALFSNRVPFQSVSVEKKNDLKYYRTKGKRELVYLARNKPTDAFNKSPDNREDFLSGWIPWFMENSLYILGWVSKGENSPVYGVELEMATLLSRIITDFPQNNNSDSAFVLLDGKNRIIHQSGSFEIRDMNRAAVQVPLSDCLPHWRVGIYLNDKHNLTENSFFYLSFILVMIFIASIVSGGALLFRQAHKNKKEAMQKTSFVASVSHELKTPLTSIRMYAELLHLGRVSDEQKTRRYLGVIVSESERLTRLVNNILDFSRLEQGKKTYNLSGFDLGEFLKDFCQTNKIRFKEENIDLCLSLDGDRFPVETDKDGIEQVFLNLMDNIIKYASIGGKAEIVLKEEDDFYLVFFKDKGPGIPEKHRKAVFEKFHRVDDSITAGKPGSGLGLSIARKILRDLGGDLRFEPEKRGGSCFIAEICKNRTILND